MRFINLVFCMVLALGFAGCSNKDKEQKCSTALEDDAIMQQYITANGVTAVKHESGLYYEIIAEGTGAVPTINSTVKANYTGKFTNNKIFDQGVASFPMNVGDQLELSRLRMEIGFLKDQITSLQEQIKTKDKLIELYEKSAK